MGEKEPLKFEDAEGYQFKSRDGLSFKQIILQHLKSISVFASAELGKGYWKSVKSSDATESQVWVQSTADIYCNSIDWLADALLPHFDKDMKDAEKKCDAELNKAKDINDDLEFIAEKCAVKRKLFRALTSFLHRKKYLSIGSVDD